MQCFAVLIEKKDVRDRYINEKCMLRDYHVSSIGTQYMRIYNQGYICITIMLMGLLEEILECAKSGDRMNDSFKGKQNCYGTVLFERNLKAVVIKCVRNWLHFRYLLTR